MNADRRESDLDVIPSDVLSLWRGKRKHAGSTGRDVRGKLKNKNSRIPSGGTS